MFVNIETDRLLIRPVKIEDSEFILNLLNSPGWLQFIGDRNVKNIIDAESYLDKILNNKKYFYHVMELKDTKQPIGILTFLYRDSQTYPDLGFAMLPEFTKKGFAFEAADNYVSQIKDEIDTEKIIAITLSDNNDSKVLIQKLGFQFEKQILENNESLILYSLNINDH